jgi:hypothetical protein
MIPAGGMKQPATSKNKLTINIRTQAVAAMYGMMAKLPVRGLVKRGVRQLFEKMYAPGVIVPDAAAPADDAVGRLLDKHGAKVDAVLDQVARIRKTLKRSRR